jgi:hypothetical protein
VNDLLGVLLVLAFTTESELILGLAVWDLVDAEPLVGSTEEARKVTLDVLNVIELGSKRVVDVNDDDLPVGLLLVEKSHDSENLDLLDLTSVAHYLTDFADVKRIIVTLSLGFGMNNVGVFPGLLHCEQVSIAVTHCTTYSWESTVVPEIALVREAVTDESKLALLDVLLDGVEPLLLGNLYDISD